MILETVKTIKNGDIVECKNIVGGQLVQCKIIDAEYNKESQLVEVELISKFAGSCAVVQLKDIVNVKETIKVTGKMEIAKFESRDQWEEVGYRTLSFYPQLSTTNGTHEELEEIMCDITTYMENELDIEFIRCPSQDEHKGVKSYTDSFDIEYRHGDMKQLKKEVMQVWKQAKKHFGIR